MILKKEQIEQRKTDFDFPNGTLESDYVDTIEATWHQRDEMIMEGLRLTKLLEDAERRRELDAAAYKEIARLRASRDTLIEEIEGKGGWKELENILRRLVSQLTIERNVLSAQLQLWQNGGLTEDILRKRDGYIKVGQGCVIVAESYLEEKEAEIEALQEKVLQHLRENIAKVVR